MVRNAILFLLEISFWTKKNKIFIFFFKIKNDGLLFELLNLDGMKYPLSKIDRSN